MPIPPSAPELLNREFLELRASLLQVAAQLDRLDRATHSVEGDPRMHAIRRAINTLLADSGGRAEQIQLIFSRPYEENWKQKLLPTDNS